VRSLAPYLFIGPALLYLLLFMVVPLARGVWLSFTDTALVNPSGGSSVGLDNYSSLLHSHGFWESLSSTVTYTAATVILSVGLGTMAAVAINTKFRGRAVARAVMTFPWAVPTVAAAVGFAWIYNQSTGALNGITKALGLGKHGWLVDPSLGMFSVVLATLWKVFPLVMLVVLASLQSVPDELLEATRIDGADRLSAFRAVILPHILPTIRVVSLLMTIWSIRRFEIIYLLTGGGPVDRTNTLVINVYRRAFSDQELGPAAAIGMLGLVISLVVTVVFFLVENRQARKEAIA
jgi:multiple sugar transport system permease protein